MSGNPLDIEVGQAHFVGGRRAQRLRGRAVAEVGCDQCPSGRRVGPRAADTALDRGRTGHVLHASQLGPGRQVLDDDLVGQRRRRLLVQCHATGRICVGDVASHLELLHIDHAGSERSPHRGTLERYGANPRRVELHDRRAGCRVHHGLAPVGHRAGRLDESRHGPCHVGPLQRPAGVDAVDAANQRAVGVGAVEMCFDDHVAQRATERLGLGHVNSSIDSSHIVQPSGGGHGERGGGEVHVRETGVEQRRSIERAPDACRLQMLQASAGLGVEARADEPRLDRRATGNHRACAGRRRKHQRGIGTGAAVLDPIAAVQIGAKHWRAERAWQLGEVQPTHVAAQVGRDRLARGARNLHHARGLGRRAICAKRRIHVGLAAVQPRRRFDRLHAIAGDMARRQLEAHGTSKCCGIATRHVERQVPGDLRGGQRRHRALQAYAIRPRGSAQQQASGLEAGDDVRRHRAGFAARVGGGLERRKRAVQLHLERRVEVDAGKRGYKGRDLAQGGAVRGQARLHNRCLQIVAHHARQL